MQASLYKIHYISLHLPLNKAFLKDRNPFKRAKQRLNSLNMRSDLLYRDLCDSEWFHRGSRGILSRNLCGRKIHRALESGSLSLPVFAIKAVLLFPLEGEISLYVPSYKEPTDCFYCEHRYCRDYPYLSLSSSFNEALNMYRSAYENLKTRIGALKWLLE